MYKAVDPKASFPKLEEAILSFWEKNHIFEKSVSQAKGDEFVFYDGPPFATGLPHFGHFLPNTIKDIIPRYQTMKGKKVERRFGWDCHGLPVENLIEKELGLNSKTDIEKFGVVKFIEACRASVLRYTKEWRFVINRLGRWVDFDNDYKTMDPDYMETIWWVMKSLWEKGLIYEGHYILPYCPRCATVLSNHELNLGGYKDVHDPAITLRFKITGVAPDSHAADEPLNASLADGSTYLLAWTTTPWTLPSNLALTLGPDIDYVLVKDGNDNYILAESRLPAYYKNPSDYTIIWRQKGAELIGLQYEPLFPYFKDAAKQNAFRTYPGDFVSTEDGTGIVHTAPGFGEDDARVLKGTGVPVICPIDAECRFTSEVPDYQGVFVKDADKAIMDRLKAEGKLIKRDQILHAYPHCWRCDHPLIYRAVGSWFVDVEKIKQDMLDANSQIYWVPEHIKTGRFGKWLEGARDWAISRNRYWGNPLPIWRCPDCGKTICIGSRAELKELSGQAPEDLHKHFVDQITIPCSKVSTEKGGGARDCKGTMTRIPEVLDCWFESGAMPYGQNHYPFENKEFFDSHFPADFINESLDQTRGWFYTLTILAAALFKKPAFKNCVVGGLVLAADGKKMSKSLKNYTDPMELVNSFGADALRLFLVHSALVKAEELKFTDDGVKDVLKSIILPLWNSYSFFVTYANIDKVSPKGAPENPSNPLDKWILSVAEALVEKVTAALDTYDLSRAVDPILEFIDLLNNWYIRRSRRRFWKSGNDSDKLEAYGALYSALKTLITVAAPFMPFITDTIWQNLRSESDPESIHLASYPVPREGIRDKNLEFKMASVQHAVSMGRSLRSQYNIKVRQPLKTVELVTRNPEEKKVLLEMEEIIREELNVKNVVFRDNEEDLVEYEAKANFRILGKELGKDMKAAAEVIAALSQSAIQGILEGSVLSIEAAGRSVEITAEKLDIRRIEKANLKVLNEDTLTVGLDTELSAELSMEGDARDLVRGVQNLRKESGFEVTDRITLKIFGSEKLKAAWEAFADYVSSETLASKVIWGESGKMADIEAGDENWKVEIEKV
ncbi:isoleucine--tRNA ligase [Leadbettera azotonutricia]|uniref:Isoleucine--tRNA ligase n=1 Tax=Leadbettera azotonutricia (strain ATCC BAA-888 / DSM 13862 / ZAS-9) TaxID=545695 RepID=F5YEZ7_LEAAZ|nr:isoleucine--tRNA ligase [Leadbettera azotonutricia]AEF81054.1 isoleucine--tRNA ligase [Leadbettera azotonutricia ZAS-9]